jgi:hypothetical protein
VRDLDNSVWPHLLHSHLNIHLIERETLVLQVFFAQNLGFDADAEQQQGSKQPRRDLGNHRPTASAVF